jgi:hypothetical protein
VRPEVDRPQGRRGDEPVAGLSQDLLADLSDWKINLHTRSFTAVSVDMLLRDLRRTVPSALGYTVVLVAVPGLPEVSITVAEGRLESGQVGSTITFGLPVAHGITARVTFYAGATGAFDLLASLLLISDTFGNGRIELTGPLDVAVEPGVHGLADHTKVNYAIGVLLARGRTVAEADRHLQRLALRHGSLEAAAEHLLMTFNA